MTQISESVGFSWDPTDLRAIFGSFSGKAHATLTPWGIAIAKKAVSAERGRPKLNDFVHSAWDRCSGRSSRLIGTEPL